MALTEFQKDLWSSKFQYQLETLTSARAHSDFQFEGEVQGGKSIKILFVTRPSVRAYVKGTSITRDGVEDSSVDMDIDQFNYFAIDMEDVDKAQSDGKIDDWAREGVRALSDAADEYVLGLTAAATQTSAELTITSANVIGAVNSGLATLYGNNVSTSEMLHLEVTPTFYVAMKEAITDLDTNNSELIEMGIVGKYGNCLVSIENQLFADTSNYNVLRTKRAIAYAEQIDSVEAFRPEDSFRDAIKALHVFGAKVIRDNEMYVIKELV